MPSAQGCVDRGDVRLTALTPKLPPLDASRPRLTRWPSRSWSTTLLPARSSRRSKAAAPRRPSEISASAAMVTRSPSATSRARSSCTTFDQPPTLAHGLRRLPVLHLCRSVRARRCLTKGDLVANRPCALCLQTLALCRLHPHRPRTLVALVRDSADLLVYDTAAGGSSTRRSIPLGLRGRPTDLDFHPTGPHIAIVSDAGELVTVNLDSGGVRATQVEGRATAVCWSGRSSVLIGTDAGACCQPCQPCRSQLSSLMPRSPYDSCTQGRSSLATCKTPPPPRITSSTRPAVPSSPSVPRSVRLMAAHEPAWPIANVCAS